MSKNTQISMFLVKSGGKNQQKILFKMFQDNMDILVVENKQSQRFFKISLNEQSLSGGIGAYFDTIKDMYDFFKQQKHESITFKPDTTSDDSDILNPKYNHYINYQIPVGLKVLKKRLQLQQHKSSQTLYEKTLMQIQQLQKVQTARVRVEQKKKRVKQLNQLLKQMNLKVQIKVDTIENSKKTIQQIKDMITKKQFQIQDIRKQFTQKNMSKYQKIQREILQKAGEQQRLVPPQIGVNPSASMIFQAMPESYELNPLGKYVQMHNGRRNLFLSNFYQQKIEQKQITDEQIQTMIGFDWSPIQVLSFGGNKLTNKAVNMLEQISDWQNVNELYLYDLPLDEASCNHILKITFTKLKQLYLDFDPEVREKCWKKVADSGLANFPVLEDLHVDNPDTISQVTKQKLLQVCQMKGVQCKLGNPNAEQCVIY